MTLQFTTCPKCGYARQPSDAAPDYECPKCGVVYAKVAQGRTLKEPEARPAARNRLFLWAIAVAIATAGGGYLVASKQAAQKERQQQEVELQRRLASERSKREIEKATAALAYQYVKWKDGYQLAISTSRVALAGPVASLQAIHREASSMIVPACLDKARNELLGGMTLVIEGFLKFMQDPKIGDFLFEMKAMQANIYFEKYEKLAAACPNPL